MQDVNFGHGACRKMGLREAVDRYDETGFHKVAGVARMTMLTLKVW